MEPIFDIAVLGGGINGCGCAADAALRGLSVVLLEQDDIASKTSSASTKLIHGGLRYLEHYEFHLVRKALKERQTLLHLAPHLVRPIAFVLPHQKKIRSAWLLRAGLFIYDNLSRKNRLPKCVSIVRKHDEALFAPLKNQFNQGLYFYDAATDDARLTLSNALQAQKQGASIRTYSRVTQAKAEKGVWHLTVQPQNAAQYTLKAKALINATGPWVNTVAQMTHTSVTQQMTLVQGSHIVVPKIYEGAQAYFLQNEDNRIVFVIPYEGQTMIGTTDVALKALPEEIAITQEEIDYLLAVVSAYFKKSLSPKDVLDSWSGVRTLLAAPNTDPKALSRDYSYQFDLEPAPVVTVYGGKITTYRQLSKEIVDQFKSIFPDLKPCATEHTPLPGAVLQDMGFEHYADYAKKSYAWLGPHLLQRYLQSYGTNTEHIVLNRKALSDLGIHFGGSLYQAEVDYLVAHEWAKTPDDVLKRRTKLHLHLKDGGQQLKDYLLSASPPSQS
jgi:glycerol-3-phosphate dehydrogenase